MDRPELKIKLQLSDWVLEFLSAAAIVLIILIAYTAFEKLIDVHNIMYYSKHRPANPNTVFIFPILAVLFYIGFSLMSLVPHTFKYPVVITPENAETEYRNGLRMLRVLKLSLILIFIGITIALSGMRISQFF